jgi:UDPglucose 6-dehydrogenase
LALASELIERGAHVVACDPKAGDVVARATDSITVCSDAFEAAQGADAVVLSTEWPEYVTIDYRRLAEGMRTPVLLDARNALDPVQAAAAGFEYLGVGRGRVPALA